MENYTVVYSTKSIKNIQYSFTASNMEAAKLFCEKKFNVPVDFIIEHSTIKLYFVNEQGNLNRFS
jgi:hypothetical protein